MLYLINNVLDILLYHFKALYTTLSYYVFIMSLFLYISLKSNWTYKNTKNGEEDFHSKE